ncbi:unnamed protein product [Penicillium salamii]|uniref:Uncharacterized protein n=1 Tax=Penicillium salamii TaxID=1612424 RepID=A0A9W4I3Z7_9EURO|nr:unnamed protein product [Penicillium salamii]CAG8361776.1 unnamed protein product [Penicillium salamii]CAG8361831.1 unnamed protein product [Penicillium salamii]CAG8368447.1 unnamed protein product [Penicillium salamii]
MPQTPRLLDYGCTDWLISSQIAADLYNSGTRLWTKEDLEDIEQQLHQSYAMERFSVRRIDGSMIQISNPMFQVPNPIWKPHVKYQEYWQLVNAQPNGPVEIYLCSYIVDWSNQTARNFRELLAQPMQVFDEKHLLWQNSKTCKHLATLVQDILGTNTVKKVLCFGLDYTEVAEEILTKKEFKIVGTHGAGGFAEVDDESIIIPPFAAAPIKQIIADLARPALIISTGFEVFNGNEKPLADAESPRTRQMWLEYDTYSLPSHSDDVEICSALKGLHLYCRRQQTLNAQGA